jgi:hypothetical protein
MVSGPDIAADGRFSATCEILSKKRRKPWQVLIR